ncbi:hypothetical protein FJZ36_12055 [Candidatus Poribacteria bacterium]|nr:hypothetical protein [Candidatus Poribacteria bacterium]
MSVFERLKRAAGACPESFLVNATRSQALLTEVAQLGRYTPTNDGIVAFTQFPIHDVEEAQKQFAPNLTRDEFVRNLHVYATTLVGEGYSDGRHYRFYLHEDGWRVQIAEGSGVRTAAMDDAAFNAFLRERAVAHAA